MISTGEEKRARDEVLRMHYKKHLTNNEVVSACMMAGIHVTEEQVHDIIVGDWMRDRMNSLGRDWGV